MRSFRTWRKKEPKDSNSHQKVSLKENPVEYAEYVENLKSHLNEQELDLFNQMSMEIENEYANECIFCGT